MLTEIEELLVKTLQDNVKGVAKARIAVAAKEANAPAISIFCDGFRIKGEEVAETTGEKKVELEEGFSIDSGQRGYRLKNKPDEVLRVELPAGTELKENVNYTVNYRKAIITFFEPINAGKVKGLVKYRAIKESIVKSLKISARYIISVQGEDWSGTDALAEETIKALLVGKEEMERQGIRLKPLAGRTAAGDSDGGQTQKRSIQLAYLLERDIIMETAFPPIAKIEITQKKT
jgi:hypothetical protein